MAVKPGDRLDEGGGKFEWLAELVHYAVRLAHQRLGCREDAEDVGQDVAVKVLTAISRFRHGSALKTWVHRITLNRIAELQRGRTRQAVRLRGWAPEDVERDDPAVELMAAERRRCGTHALSRTAPAERHALRLWALEEEHPAAALSLTPAAYRKRVSRSTARLRQFMASHCGRMGATGCGCKGSSGV